MNLYTVHHTQRQHTDFNKQFKLSLQLTVWFSSPDQIVSLYSTDFHSVKTKSIYRKICNKTKACTLSEMWYSYINTYMKL